MAGGSSTFSFSRWPEATRWGTCFALAIAFHAVGAAALFARWTEDSNLVGGPPVIMVDLAPVAVSPNTLIDSAPAPVLQQEAEPEPEPEKPIEKIELPPDPQAAPVVAMPPPKPIEKPKENKPKQKHASIASAPTRTEQRADRLAAPIPGASSRNSDALPNWITQVSAKIQRNKRYPSDAHGDLGVVLVSFSVDRQGGIHSVRLAKSSGSSALDREALALVQRAEPLPPPPPEIISGAQISLSQRINYSR